MDSLEEKIRNLRGEVVEETIIEIMRRLKEDESKKQAETKVIRFIKNGNLHRT